MIARMVTITLRIRPRSTVAVFKIRRAMVEQEQNSKPTALDYSKADPEDWPEWKGWLFAAGCPGSAIALIVVVILAITAYRMLTSSD